MINVSGYPLCAKRLQFQKANLSDEAMTKYWAAVCVAFDIPDVQLTQFGGFDFGDMSDKNGGALLSHLEKFLGERGKRAVANYGFASEGLKALIGARGIKTSRLKSEDDYWTAAETLFPGCIDRNGGFTSLYVQIHSIPKKKRSKLMAENLHRIPVEWLSKAGFHQAKIQKSGAAA